MSFRIDQLAVYNLATVGGSITAGSLVKSGGTSSQFLKADGSVDTNAYITGITSGMVTTALGYTPVPNTRTLTINGTTYDLTADRSWTISAGVSSVSGSGAGISVSPTTGAVVVSNTGVTSNVAGTGISVSGATGAVTITNTGVTSIVAGTAITISGATGAVTINNAGVTSLNGSTGALTGFATQAWVTSQGYITSASVGNGTLTLAVSGSGLSGSASFTANQSTATTFTVTSNATNANTASTIVFRDASGNFSAGTITAALSGNASTASTWQTARTLTIGSTGKSVNGSADVSWSLSEIGAPSTTGTGASGTWGISITGNSATVSTLATLGTGISYNTDRTVKISNGLAIYGAYNGGANSPWTYDLAAQFIRDSRGFEFSASWHAPSATLAFRTLRDCCDNWSSWVTMLSSSNYNSYSPTLTGGGASGTWSINITGNAGYASSAGNADTVDNFHASQSTVANNIVVRDGNGYIFGNYINMTDDGNPGGGTSISSFITKQGDNYYRSVSPTNAMVSIRGVASGSWGINVTGTAGSETLATVTGRGASTSTAVSFNNVVSVTSSSIGMDWWRDGSGTYMEFYGTSTATRKLRLQGSDGSGNYAQWFIDGGNQQIYGTVTGVTNFLMNSSVVYLRHGGSDKFWTGSDGTRNAGWLYMQNGGNGIHYPGYNSHFYMPGGNYWHINPTEGSGYGALILYSNYNSISGGSTYRKGYLYYDSNGFGLLGGGDGDWAINVNTSTSKYVTIGGHQGSNACCSVSGVRLMFGGGNSDAQNNYYIGTNYNNYNGNYNKLDLAWHTGIRIGAQTVYGGIRMYNDEDFSSLIFSVGEGDSNVRVTNNLYMGGNIVATQSWVNSQGFITGGSFLPYGNWSGDTGMNDYRLYLRTSGDTNHYLWNAGDDWEELGAYAGTGFRVTSNNGANGLLYVYGSSNGGYTYSPYSFRAPIFYDSDNTSYYLDPASTSNLNGLQVGGSAVVTNNGGTWNINVTGSAGSASTASQVTINYNNDSNSTYQMLWGSGNSVYGTAGVYVNPYDDRLYANYFSSAFYMDVYTSAGADYLRISDNQVYRPNGGILYLNWSSNANVAITGSGGGYVGVGNNSPSYKMHVSGDIYANGGWLRVSGTSGLYFESYGGGWHMTDTSYIRSYNAKSLHMNYASVDYVGSMYLESGGQGVHLQPNTGSYGSLQVTGSRGGWHGIRFTGNNVNIMVNTNEVGFHNNGAGWQFLWSAGTAYVYKGGTGGGTSATVLDSSNAPYAWNMNQYVRTTDNPTFNILTLSSYLTVGNGLNSSDIYMYDGDEGTRRIHCNSNRIGFLNQSAGWGSYCDDTGNWITDHAMYASNWFRAYGDTGLYSQDYGGHIRRTVNASHGTWEIFGYNKGGYAGLNIYDPQGYNNNYMHESGNGGLYQQNGYGWIFYWYRPNSCLGIGTSTTSSSYRMYVNGGLYATNDIVAYSDRRKKTDIVTIDNALDKVINLRGVFYTKVGEEDKGRKTGVIAQEINEVLPEVVTYAADVDEYGVSYGNIAGVLIEAIKEQNELIKTLKSEIDELKAKLN